MEQAFMEQAFMEHILIARRRQSTNSNFLARLKSKRQLSYIGN